MPKAPQGTARKTVADARRHIDRGNQHVHASQARLERAESRILDSLVRIARLASQTFRNLK